MDKNIKILYVEDEASLAMIVKESLETRGFEVYLVSDGAKAVQAFENVSPDICVLDVMLPNVNGYDIGKAIRKINPQVPILFLTAKVQTKDVLTGFESGGNDYIKKPFSMEELIIRVQNLHQLVQGSEHTESIQYDLKGATFYPRRQELEIDSAVEQLSHRESKLLEMLCIHQNETCHRKDILMDLWGDDSFFNSRNLDVYITRLRKRLSGASKAEIVTLKGVGYLFKV